MLISHWLTHERNIFGSSVSSSIWFRNCEKMLLKYNLIDAFFLWNINITSWGFHNNVPDDILFISFLRIDTRWNTISEWLFTCDSLIISPRNTTDLLTRTQNNRNFIYCKAYSKLPNNTPRTQFTNTSVRVTTHRKRNIKKQTNRSWCTDWTSQPDEWPT